MFQGPRKTEQPRILGANVFRTWEHRTLGQLIGRTGEYRTLERIYEELMFVCFHLALSRFICPSQQSPDYRDGYRSAQIASLHFNETVCAVRLFKPEHAVQYINPLVKGKLSLKRWMAGRLLIKLFSTGIISMRVAYCLFVATCCNMLCLTVCSQGQPWFLLRSL